MKKFLTMFLFLLLIGARCFGTALPYPGREVSIEIVSSATHNGHAGSTMNPAEATAYGEILSTATTSIVQNGGVASTGLVFNHQPFRWVPAWTDLRMTNPSSETDLEALFANLYWGKPHMEFGKPWRTLFVHFVQSVPDASALTGGKYVRGSHKGITWAYPAHAGYHEVAFALGGSPLAIGDDFTEAFRLYFATRHGVAGATTGDLQVPQVEQLRSRLLDTQGLGCYEAVITHKMEFSNRLSAAKQWVFSLTAREHIPNRCYRLESSPDLIHWTEIWFGIHAADATVNFHFAKGTNKKMFYRYSLCWDK